MDREVSEPTTSGNEQKVTSLENAMKHYFSNQLSMAQLSEGSQTRIKANKFNYPGHEKQLIDCLNDVDLSEELANFLTWIPFEQFTVINQIASDGRSTTFRGTVSCQDSRGFACPPNHDMPQSWEKNNRDGQWFYDYREQRQCILKTYNQGNEAMFKLQMFFSVLLSNFGDPYDAPSPIGFTRRSKDELPYIVMEFTNAENLSDMFEKHQDQTWSDIWRYAVFLASGLRDFHRLGAVHCDLHPGNVVIAGDKSLPYIVNFGLSRHPELQQKNENIQHPGEPTYFPPEAFTSAQPSQAYDIYCLGILLWQLVTTVPPRGSLNTIQRDDGLRDDLIPGVPKSYENIYISCWNPDPRKRPTAQQVVDQLLDAESEIRSSKGLSAQTVAFVVQRIEEQKARTEKPMSGPQTAENIIENDKELFSRIRRWTPEQYITFARDNPQVARRYLDFMDSEKAELDKNAEELKKLEKRVDLEIKKAYPWKWLRRLLGYGEYSKDSLPGTGELSTVQRSPSPTLVNTSRLENRDGSTNHDKAKKNKRPMTLASPDVRRGTEAGPVAKGFFSRKRKS